MEKIHKGQPIKLSPIKMYWDDLEEIYNRIEKGSRKVTVESEEYKYESLKELNGKTKKKYINQIRLIGHGENFDDYISVDISSGGTWIHQNAGSTETAAKIKEILNDSSPWYMYSPASQVWHTMIGVLGFSAFLIISFFSLKVENIYLAIIMYPIGFGIWLWTIKSEPIFGGTKIFTCFRKYKLNFWERNKEQFLRDIIIALIASISSFLFAYLLPK